MKTSPGPGDANPYEAPKADLVSARPSRRDLASDQLLASRLLVARARRGYPLGLWLRWNAKPYLLLVGCLIVYLSMTAATGYWIPFSLLLGLGLGTMLRDVGWLRAIRKRWSFSERVTDWEEVERLAAGGPDTG